MQKLQCSAVQSRICQSCASTALVRSLFIIQGIVIVVRVSGLYQTIRLALWCMDDNLIGWINIADKQLTITLVLHAAEHSVIYC